ncbi:MAG: ferritin family protein [Candidatus Delongbacteria bacterium]|nr:ferritin family protein [Candidatus Delongbacteria bacterium]
MKKDDFNAIIDFAVDREKEAVEFYQYLQTKSKFAEIKEMLKDLEEMEKGHIGTLEKVREKGIKEVKVNKVNDLHIADYMADIEPSPEMDYQNILIVAMKREEKSKELYEDLAVRFAGTDIEKLLLKIASDESGHKLKFEILYDEHVLKEN